MAVINRIRYLRSESNELSQAQLARDVDISRQTLNAIERGHRVPTLEIAHRIADALDCELNDVFHYESEFADPDEDDGAFRIIVRFDTEPGSHNASDWWEDDDVSRVTTRAKRCSDAAR